ncbi:MAG: hypothetical protein LRY73_05465 [Bacillus sp. (in: Bacteria)]|nr:hypothetical protein [Bacillus sp. (in: firmicutes)]
MLKTWEGFSKWARFCFVSSFIAFLAGITWLIYDYIVEELTIWSPARSFIILGIVLLLIAIKEMGTNKANEKITLENIEKKLSEMGFDKDFVTELVSILDVRMKRDGIQEFQKWFRKLNYRLPEDFHDQALAHKIYKNHLQTIEAEVTKLEKETHLSWEEQTRDLQGFDAQTRKVQLVIRHRLSDIALDLTD